MKMKSKYLVVTLLMAHCFSTQYFFSLLFLGPKNCNEAFDAYGRTSNTYELYPTEASSPILVYCEAKVDGGTSFLVPSRKLPILVSGPLPTSPYEIPIGYEPASVMIKSATLCEQVVTYICNKTEGGVVNVYMKTSSPIADGTCLPSCSCKVSGSAVNTENETFTNKEILPISKITVGEMTTLEQKIHIKVGDVVCNECKLYTCIYIYIHIYIYNVYI